MGIAMTTESNYRAIGNAGYLGGAAASIFAAIPFAIKHADVFASLPWRELTSWVKYPWEAIGIGEVFQVAADGRRYREDGVRRLHPLEHVGRAMRCANVLAYPIAFMTNDNALYSIALTGGTTVAGHCVEEVGKSLRSRRERISE